MIVDSDRTATDILKIMNRRKMPGSASFMPLNKMFTRETEYPTHSVSISCIYLYRGYYPAVRRYEFYLRVVKTIYYERVQRVSKILFSPREDKIHIFKPPCNVLFII